MTKITEKDVDFAIDIEDDFETPLLFVDGFQGMAMTRGLIGGVVKINLFQDVQRLGSGGEGAQPQFVRKPIARLVMIPETIVSLHQWLGENIASMKIVEAMVDSNDNPTKKD